MASCMKLWKDKDVDGKGDGKLGSGPGKCSHYFFFSLVSLHFFVHPLLSYLHMFVIVSAAGKFMSLNVAYSKL